MDFSWLMYIIAGASVGIAIGITGIGGGSLMTPLLLMFGFPPHTAIGTDLLYAAITKSGGAVAHHHSGNIDWKVVGHMAAGSIPAAIIVSFSLKYFFGNAQDYSHLLTFALGIMLLLTSCIVFFRQKIRTRVLKSKHIASSHHLNAPLITVISGILIGVFVTLSSVGAGVIGTAVLLFLYPHFLSQRIVGTDIAHAVPLTLIAGLAHLWLGNVDFVLLGCLLAGSLPAIHLGTAIGNRLPNRILQPVLAFLLFSLGLKLVFF